MKVFVKMTLVFGLLIITIVIVRIIVVITTVTTNVNIDNCGDANN